MYIPLLEEYLRQNAGTDGTSLFIYEFSDLYRETQKDVGALEAGVLETGISRLDNFSIDSASTRFVDLVEALFGECEAQTERENELPDYQFRSLIRFILSEMKECGAIYNDNEVLQSVIVFLSSVSAIAYSILNPTLFNLIWK